MFRTVPLSIIRSSSLYTQQWYMSWTELVPSWSCSQAVSKPVWHIPLLRVQWKTPDDGQRNCPKHVEFYSKNKFEKLVHLVGFIVRNFASQSSTYKTAKRILFTANQTKIITINSWKRSATFTILRYIPRKSTIWNRFSETNASKRFVI